MLVAPSILSADFLHLSQDVELVNSHADLFHLDVMDGTFVPNISFGFPVVEAIAKKACKPMDVHLMIVHPEKYIERFAKTGAEMISFHYEAARDNASEVIGLIHACGAKAGIAINPDCPVENIFPFFAEVDFVVLMSVFAGFGGQKFIEDSYGRIASILRERERTGTRFLLEIDGGVTTGNAGKLQQSGADILVAGSAVFKAPDPAAAISAIRGYTPVP